MFTKRIQPLFDATVQAGNTAKSHKEAFFEPFKSRGITGGDFKKMYFLLRERNNKKRTIKSITEQFRNVSTKDVQELAKHLAASDRKVIDLMDIYTKKQSKAIAEADKWYGILQKHSQEVDQDLITAYDDIIVSISMLDDEVRKGLK